MMIMQRQANLRLVILQILQICKFAFMVQWNLVWWGGIAVDAVQRAAELVEVMEVVILEVVVDRVVTPADN